MQGSCIRVTLFTSRVWVDAALSGRLGSSLIAFLFYVAFLIFLVMGQSTGNVALIYAFFFSFLFFFLSSVCLLSYFHFICFINFVSFSFFFLFCLSFFHHCLLSPIHEITWLALNPPRSKISQSLSAGLTVNGAQRVLSSLPCLR